MMSVAAAALIAGTGFAYAQGTGTQPSAGSAAQQSAPSGGAMPSGGSQMNRDAAEPGGPSGMKAKQSEQKSPGGAKSQSAQDTKAGARDEKSAQEKPALDKSAQDKAGAKQEKSAQDNMKQDNIKGDKSKSLSSDTDRDRGAKDMKAEGRDGRDNMKAGDNMRGDSNRTQTTVGQAGAGARLAPEQRTRISSVIRDQHVQPLNTVNFAISVGALVPREVSFRPLPAEVVTIYPEWRGYEFFLVRDQIVVVNPRTMEIVAILEA
jgi:hypothetical protein